MFFFVNQYLLSSNSSVEHAELKRLQLFKAHQTPAKLVTRDFDLVLHSTLKKFKLDDQQVVNMYDFFAGTTDYQGKVMHIEDLSLPIDYQVGTGNNYREVKDGDRLVCEVHFAAGTVGQINHVDYYDAIGNLTLRQQYDLRGFKAADDFYGQDGRLYYSRYYRPDGECYLERYYVKSTENTPINSLNILKNYQGQDRFFNSLDELFIFFLDELNRENGGQNTFIADRPAVAIQPLQAMTTKAKRFLWIPMNHVNDGEDVLTGKLNGMLIDPLLNNPAKWDGVIVMTRAQAKDLQERINHQLPVYAINGTPVTPQPKILMNERKAKQLIYVGRLGEDKQIRQLINIFAQVHQQVPESKLTLYGYGTPADTKDYQQQVQNNGLSAAVNFAGYQVPVEQYYDQAQLFIDASRIDGQPLAMGEALSHGVPVVSYDYLYGPAEMIKSGINGELIPLNDQAKFVQTLVALLQDDTRLQELSANAYKNIESLSTDQTWLQWQKLM